MFEEGSAEVPEIGSVDALTLFVEWLEYSTIKLISRSFRNGEMVLNLSEDVSLKGYTRSRLCHIKLS